MRDSQFKFLFGGQLRGLLAHWKRLPLVTNDILNLLNSIFKAEPARISMDELKRHPFVGLIQSRNIDISMRLETNQQLSRRQNESNQIMSYEQESKENANLNYRQRKMVAVETVGSGNDCNVNNNDNDMEMDFEEEEMNSNKNKNEQRNSNNGEKTKMLCKDKESSQHTNFNRNETDDTMNGMNYNRNNNNNSSGNISNVQMYDNGTERSSATFDLCSDEHKTSDVSMFSTH